MSRSSRLWGGHTRCRYALTVALHIHHLYCPAMLVSMPPEWYKLALLLHVLSVVVHRLSTALSTHHLQADIHLGNFFETGLANMRHKGHIVKSQVSSCLRACSFTNLSSLHLLSFVQCFVCTMLSNRCGDAAGAA